jgi:hypothetical protein
MAFGVEFGGGTLVGNIVMGYSLLLQLFSHYGHARFNSAIREKQWNHSTYFERSIMKRNGENMEATVCSNCLYNLYGKQRDK